VRIRVADGELARLEGSKLVAGMPVEAFLQTSPRTVMSYLADAGPDRQGVQGTVTPSVALSRHINRECRRALFPIDIASMEFDKFTEATMGVR
jgi:hypothetical protein